MKLSSFNEVVHFAIKREEEAINNYGRMIDIGKLPGIKEMLQELQDEEKKHKKLLQRLTEGKVESYVPNKVTNLKLSDFTEEESLNVEMDIQDLILFAAKKEQEAVELYSHLAEKAESGEVKKIFEILIEQEKSHKLKLESEYEKHFLQED